MVLHDNKQAQAKHLFEIDVERYLFLTESDSDRSKGPHIKQANTLGLFGCHNDPACAKSWAAARPFLDLHSTEKAEDHNDVIVLNALPTRDSDINLALTKITISQHDHLLYLGIHCKETAAGKKNCSPQKINELRMAFRDYVNARLAGAAQ